SVSIDVVVDGVGGGLRDNVIATLSVVRYRDQPGLNETAIRRLHARAPDEVRAALRPFGYYEPTVRSTLQNRGGGRWSARYTVDPGPPVLVSRVEVVLDGEGAHD